MIQQLSSMSQMFAEKGVTPLDKDRLIAGFRNGQDAVKHSSIIRTMKPISCHTRESEISRHHAETFQWIVDGSEQSGCLQTGFLDWLRTGHGVFHFAGKPGAGKSTLLKFLANDVRAHTALSEWAASDKKDLIVSKFFFWRHGSNEQKTVSGMLRGLLHGMCSGSSVLTKLLFPELWEKADARGLVELPVTDADIRDAFKMIQINPEVFNRFRLCLFIDGLDEFDDQEMTSLWGLARMLHDWTTQSGSTTKTHHLKLCVSSREEYPIMTVFQNSHQVRVQDITREDMLAVVDSRLRQNRHFRHLQQTDKTGCTALMDAILKGADGVFLWTTMVLNLLEDELPGASSVEHLVAVIQSTPSRLESFISSILDTIKAHHRRGAYFILAMALRMLGHHLNDDDKFSKDEQLMYEDIFGLKSNWRPHLPTYGLSAVVRAVLNYYSSKSFDFRVEELSASHEDVCHNTAVTIKTWCKGLIDVDAIDAREVSVVFLQSEDYYYKNGTATGAVGKSTSSGGCVFNFCKFAHRSVPDFLLSVIRSKAVDYSFTDDDIAQGIIAALIQELCSSYNDSNQSSSNPACYMQHVLRLLRLRKLSTSSPILSSLDRLEVARFRALQRLNPAGSILNLLNLSFPVDLNYTDAPGTQQFFSLFLRQSRLGHSASWWKSYLPWCERSTVLAHASHTGLYEYLTWKFEQNSDLPDGRLLYSALCGLTSFYSSFWGEFPPAYTETLRRLLKAGLTVSSPSGRLTQPGHPRFMYWAALLDPDTAQAGDDEGETRPPYEWAWNVVMPSVLDGLASAKCPPGLWDFLEVLLSAGLAPPENIACWRNVGCISLPEDVFIRCQFKTPSGSWEELAIPKARFTRSGMYPNFARCSEIASCFGEVGVLQPGTSRTLGFRELVEYHKPRNAVNLLKQIQT